MLDKSFNIKKLKRRVNWENKYEILNITEQYCKNVFHAELFSMFGTTQKSIAKHLTAFLCTKKSLGVFKARGKKRGATQTPQEICEIAGLVPLANEVLYNYNKMVFNAFMDKIENVIIVELFLNELNEYYMNQYNSSKQVGQIPKRIQKENTKNEQTTISRYTLQFEPMNQDHWSELPKFSDFFKDKNPIKMKWLDNRDYDWNQNIQDPFVMYAANFQKMTWLLMEKKLWLN